MQDEGNESRYPDHVLAADELRRSKPNRAAFTSLPRNPVTVVLDGVTGNYNLGAIFHHMIIGDDVPIFVDNEPGAGYLMRLRRDVRFAAVPEELTQLVQRIGPAAFLAGVRGLSSAPWRDLGGIGFRFGRHFDRDIHHARLQTFGQLREFIAAVNCFWNS